MILLICYLFASESDRRGLLYYSQGRYSEAEPLYLQALSIGQQQLGTDHPSTQLGWQNFRYLL